VTESKALPSVPSKLTDYSNKILLSHQVAYIVSEGVPIAYLGIVALQATKNESIIKSEDKTYDGKRLCYHPLCSTCRLRC
jgi:hypothetical protein